MQRGRGCGTMTDLVDSVCDAMAYQGTKSCMEAGHPVVHPNSRQQQAMARAAIVAVLDDLMKEDFASSEIYKFYGQHLNARYDLHPCSPDGRESLHEIVKALVAAKRREVGLSSPTEPQDTRYRDLPTNPAIED